MRSADRWVLYRLEQRDGKRTKVPYQARSPERRAAVNEPSTWAPFNVALAAYRAGNADGLGFVLGEGITGIDLDHCIDPTTGEIAAWAREIVAQLASYTERSPSGTGLHVLVRGGLPSGGRRKGPVEMYDDGRFFTVTGDHLDGTPTEIEARTDELAALHAKTFPPAERKAAPESTTTRQVDLDFDELVRRASAASNGPKFAALLAGDTSGYSSQSDADLAFANILAFWTARNATRMDEVFRRSGLMRPKWDARRGQCTYGERTIARAIEGCRDTYRSRDETVSAAPRDDVPPPAAEDDPAAAATDDLVEPPGHPMPNARHFLKSRHAHAQRTLLVYQGGAFFTWGGRSYRQTEDAEVRAALYHHFESLSYINADQKLSLYAPTKKKIADLLDALAAIAYVPAEMKSPSWFDQDTAIAPPHELIACENGLLHWPTRRLFAHTPNFYNHHATPFGFDATAAKPKRWLEFLLSLWDDHDAIATLQEIFGYILCGDTSQQKLFLLLGAPRSGKGTIARILTSLVGQHHVAGPTLASFATNFGLQALIGKPLAIIADARLGTRADGSVVTERLLSISGEDTLTIDRKNKSHHTIKLPTRVLILSNELPKFSDASGALSSRFIVLTFTKSFLGKENTQLTDDLRKELPGILNWALDGLARLRARGFFLQPQASVGTLNDLNDLAAPVGAFVRDRCRLGPEHSIASSDLYAAFKEWSDSCGHPRRNATVFGRDLRAAYPQIRRSQPRNADAPRGNLYVGITLGSGSGRQEAADATPALPPLGFGRCISCGDDLPAGVELAECRDCRIGREEMQP